MFTIEQITLLAVGTLIVTALMGILIEFLRVIILIRKQVQLKTKTHEVEISRKEGTE